MNSTAENMQGNAQMSPEKPKIETPRRMKMYVLFAPALTAFMTIGYIQLRDQFKGVMAAAK